MPPRKPKSSVVKETPAEYEATGQYLPVHDKAAALDAIFKDSNVKYGLALFAGYECNALDLWQKAPTRRPPVASLPRACPERSRRMRGRAGVGERGLSC
jgi:hypothetical protein